MSDWGWHQFENTNHLQPSESEKSYDFGHGHPEVYAVEYKKNEDGRHKQATEYFRVNPHRLNLGTIGLSLKNTLGEAIPLTALKQPQQSLQLWDGEIESSFRADGEMVEVTTGVHPQKDALFARVKSNLLKDQRATISLRFSYPTGKHADDANDWRKPEKHQSVIIAQDNHSAVIERVLDATKYYVLLSWSGNASLQECDRHHFELRLLMMSSPSRQSINQRIRFPLESPVLPSIMPAITKLPSALGMISGSQGRWLIFRNVLTPGLQNSSVV
jgi:hypothetical protein